MIQKELLTLKEKIRLCASRPSAAAMHRLLIPKKSGKIVGATSVLSNG
jgi:hypothetical protein